MLVQCGFHGTTGGRLAKLFAPVNPSAGDSCVSRGTVAKAGCLWHCGGMKFLCVASLLFAGLLLTARAQQDADDKYIGIYGLIQQADDLAATGDPGEALAAYSDAQNHLLQFQKTFPDWNPKIVSFRLSHLAEKIDELKSRSAMVESAKIAVQAGTNSPASAPPASPTTSAELDNLRAQLQREQAANEALQAKLKEALGVQPAAVDPRELAGAQEKIRSLMKQVDLITASYSAVTSAIPVKAAVQIVTNIATVFVTNALPPVTNFATLYVTNNNTVVVTNVSSVVIVDTNALAMARLEHAVAVKNFNDEHNRAEKLADELARLQLSFVSATNSDAALAGLRAENDRLKTELATLRTAPSAAVGDDTASADLKSSQALVASLRSQAEVATLEKIALQNKLQEFQAATNAGGNVADDQARIRDLTLERDNLIEKLDLAKKQNSGGKNVEAAAQLAALNDEVVALRSRLAVLEASAVPYTTEELALFKSSPPVSANPDAEKKSISEMPAGTAALVASAQQHFVHQEFDAAEADYLKILDHDQNNGIALANLATIELQQGKLDAAEKHITAALAQTPNDAYNLSTLGYLKFRQEKYDDALKALSRAEQIDPNNPEIENYLGVALSHQGQRKAAETALRRAIQLNPAYAPAHNNLAVIYLSQAPPLAELARWHYQKALDAGQPRNPDLEKMLADKGAPVNQ
jgi:tetratricopeptide (TPR) repeat protein